MCKNWLHFWGRGSVRVAQPAPTALPPQDCPHHTKGASSPLTVHVIDLEQKLELVHFRAVGEDGEPVHQLLQANGAVAVLVKQLKEAVGKETLMVGNRSCSKVM